MGTGLERWWAYKEWEEVDGDIQGARTEIGKFVSVGLWFGGFGNVKFDIKIVVEFFLSWCCYHLHQRGWEGATWSVGRGRDRGGGL